MFKNKNILVTGGAGAIGINLIEDLLKSNVENIFIIDNLSSGHYDFLPKDKKIKLIILDLLRFDELRTQLKKIKIHYVFHLAAHFANQNSVEHPYSDLATNVIGTLNLLELLKYKRELLKFIYASSSCVYGNNNIMQEDSNIYPFETPYAINKFTGELYCKYFAFYYNLPVVILRIFNTYGKYELANKYRNVIPKFIENALHDEDIVITGKGDEVRDFTYVKDTVSLMIKCSLSGFVKGEIFNAGTGIPTKIIDLANCIKKIANSNSNIKFIEKRKWDDIKVRISNIEKSKKLLNYNPEYSLEKGLQIVINWYKKVLNYEK